MSTTDFSEVVIETCTGDINRITFDEEVFRLSKTMANQALADLVLVAADGRGMRFYRDNGNVTTWVKHFPPWAHISRLQVNKCNRESTGRKPVTARFFNCEHRALVS